MLRHSTTIIVTLEDKSFLEQFDNLFFHCAQCAESSLIFSAVHLCILMIL